MTSSAGFTVADLRSQAGDEAFRAAGEHVAAIDGPYEDEWSLYATIELDDGRTLETILHHRVGGSLAGECDCPQGPGLRQSRGLHQMPEHACRWNLAAAT
jgi:hypothetical protein